MKLITSSIFLALASVAAADLGFRKLEGPKIDSTLPESLLHINFPPSKVNLREFGEGKRIILLSLPGAFTPTWSNVQVPGYLKAQDALREANVDHVLIFCGNDGAVMDAWAKSLGVEDNNKDNLVVFMGDPHSDAISALDLSLLHPGPTKGKGLVGRGKRAAIFAVDSTVKIVRIAEGENDPAGDDNPDITLVESMIESIKGFDEAHAEL